MAAQDEEIPADLQRLIDQFIAFCYDEARLLDRINLRQTRLTVRKGTIVLQLPYMDRNRQKLRLHVTRKQDRWCFSDAGKTLDGCKRSVYQTYLRHVVQWYGVQVNKGVMALETPAAGFAGRLYTFIRVLRTLDHLVQSHATEAA
jgi:hypothetical protein